MARRTGESQELEILTGIDPNVLSYMKEKISMVHSKKKRFLKNIFHLTTTSIQKI